ncbi:hypothetical protein HOY80DRAFT_1109973 [Tuber brumale]|nr:hypothetical protein HOY80DRAFT_1109973 [Tuber brumale]
MFPRPGANSGKAVYGQEGPVLSAAWSMHGDKKVPGAIHSVARLRDLAGARRTQVVAQHDLTSSIL